MIREQICRQLFAAGTADQVPKCSRPPIPAGSGFSRSGAGPSAQRFYGEDPDEIGFVQSVEGDGLATFHILLGLHLGLWPDFVPILLKLCLRW